MRGEGQCGVWRIFARFLVLRLKNPVEVWWHTLVDLGSTGTMEAYRCCGGIALLGPGRVDMGIKLVDMIKF